MNRKAFWIGLVATLAAIAVHFYLAKTHYEVKFGGGSPGSTICKVGEAFDCSAVAASRYSEVFGIPVAVFGMLANAVALFFAFLYYFADETSRAGVRKQLLTISGFIALVSIIMGSIAALLVGKGCLFCMIAYILSFTSFAGYYIASKNDATQKSSPLYKNKFEIKPLIVSTIIALIFALVINYGWQKTYGAQNIDVIVNSHVSEWAESQPVQITPVAPIATGAEESQAKMTIIEFVDFLCPHCKMAGPTLHAFVSSHKDVRLIFQTWPLDGECNSQISVTTGLRCGLARLTFCAQKLDSTKSWKMIDWIFEKQETFKDDRALLEPTTKDAAAALGFNGDELLACVNSDEAKTAIKQQADLGQSLKLSGTPTIFVNGKKLSAGQILPVLKGAYDRL